MNDPNDKKNQLIYIQFFSLLNEIISNRFNINELIKGLNEKKSFGLEHLDHYFSKGRQDPWVCVFGPAYHSYNIRYNSIEEIALSPVNVDIDKYANFINGNEALLRRIEVIKILSCLCMDYWSKEEAKRSGSIIALIKKELEGKDIKEKNTGIHLMVCWNMLDKGLREMFFSQYFNTLAHWHVNPIEPKRMDLENIRLIKV